jgi:hypothetical protein
MLLPLPNFLRQAEICWWLLKGKRMHLLIHLLPLLLNPL